MGASCAWTEPHLGQKHHGFGSALSGSPLRGVVGQNVVLPCKYHVDNKNNITTMYLPNHKGSDSCFLQLLLSVESSPSSDHHCSLLHPEEDPNVPIYRSHSIRLSSERSVAATVTQVSSSVTPRWLSISSSEAPQAFAVSTSVHLLEPESRGTGMSHSIRLSSERSGGSERHFAL
ncbi:unnamed protein product [Caretta caretta]